MSAPPPPKKNPSPASKNARAWVGTQNGIIRRQHMHRARCQHQGPTDTPPFYYYCYYSCQAMPHGHGRRLPAAAAPVTVPWIHNARRLHPGPPPRAAWRPCRWCPGEERLGQSSASRHAAQGCGRAGVPQALAVPRLGRVRAPRRLAPGGRLAQGRDAGGQGAAAEARCRPQGKPCPCLGGWRGPCCSFGEMCLFVFLAGGGGWRAATHPRKALCVARRSRPPYSSSGRG